ncbi:hypothetical protein PAXINDRAFT_17215 [Paxillus involutus ATCC 200175]|uniref:Unplaced genomic scaffold PAXINscaffold_118, whole genome shotgun sequence n=1 Tax=Paxillus involutus ATCC 200175 TaxID=664439 RepID=A0A0C9TFV6_PAXIN|nr:hypothetical protein PAXINDRAFT_17215 [Paxillus involutus ATCC 200175]
MPVELSGGYVLELSQAREWAEKFFSNNPLAWVDVRDIDLEMNIQSHLNAFYRDNDKCVRCLCIWWEESQEGDEDTGIFFPVAWAECEYGTRDNHHHFDEGSEALAVKKQLFEAVGEQLSYSVESIRFVTIFEPYETHE